MLHTENVARVVQTESFQNIGRGGEGVYNVLHFQKSRGGKNSPRGVKGPLNEALYVH